ncbi:phosphatase PAP2 family protein [Paenibacillus cisolokensis]|uniref:phosphatase PAP2 family protein n=1 Tax=Paenibacillus cisolokensis TaxID=1658519 RepID=UPI003D2CBE31
MVLFHSMNDVIWYTTLTVIILLAYGTGANPLRVGGRFVRELAVSRSHLLLFAALLGILLLNKLELSFEGEMQYGADFTPLFYAIEGDLVANIQQLLVRDWLTPVMSFMYIVVFQSLLIASLVMYVYLDPTKRLYRATCYAIMINYVIAIPFFLYFPVNEAWFYHSNVSFPMLETFPAFESEYRHLSGLDNCFPSLHTSISVTLSILAFRSKIRRWAWLVGISAAVIITSIFYLGIHWMTDMLGGTVLGIFSAALGLYFSRYDLPAGRTFPVPGSMRELTNKRR